MKRIDGQEVANANAPLKLTITQQDIKNGARKNPNACAVVVSALRQLGATAGKAHLGCIYLNIRGKWRRFHTSQALRTEIVVFDRGGKFCPGEYYLLPVPISALIGGTKTLGVRRTARRSRVGTAGPRHKRIPRHRTEDVRDTAHSNEGVRPE